MRYGLDPPPRLVNGQQKCHWCTGTLHGLPRINHVPGTDRYYCTQSCRDEGEKDHAKRVPPLQSRWYLAVAGMLAVLMIAFASTPRARAQDEAEHKPTDHHHPFHKDFYAKWKEPGNPNASCCNARIEQDGHETGDCEPSKAEVRNGDWYVWIKQVKKWERVDDNQIVRDPNPNIFDAHVCWTQSRGIICFKPPDTGG